MREYYQAALGESHDRATDAMLEGLGFKMQLQAAQEKIAAMEAGIHAAIAL